MGNSSTKESRPQSRGDNSARPSNQETFASDANALRPSPQAPRSSRGRHNGSFLGLVGPASTSDADARRETKQERDARRAKKEQASRLRERERSLREEGVDGGYLVTLGTYTGPEDFSKATVRQLMLERRLAPFWRGLNEHSNAWTEYQLVAAARGLKIPAPDEIPPELLSPIPTLEPPNTPRPWPIPIQMGPSDRSLSTSTPSSAYIGSSPGGATSSALFRGRSKTLASLSPRNDSQTDLAQQELRLPPEPQINGQPVEAYLYKDVLECPICFLYYPPYLNRTRCCDQPICSECFVQIKRPDPHPPEHTDPNSPVPEDIRRLEQEGQLISEPACCPFCVQSEFGITYEAPPLRRGLAYANMPFSKTPTAYGSSPNAHSNGTPLVPGRRRGQSVGAGAPGVITTDRVRPDWASKLAEARSQAARRSAAASALHAAAYTMDGSQSRLAFGRRRRQFMVDPNGEEGGLPVSNIDLLMAALGDQGSSRGTRQVGGAPMSRFAQRGDRADDLEDLMMMEAIRQSLAAEEERQKKEDKKAKKDEKQKVKDQAKEQKAAEKASKKGRPYPPSNNTSSMFTADTITSGSTAGPPEEGKGKGRASASEGASTATMLGFNPLSEPTSTLNTELIGADATPRAQDQEYSRSVFEQGQIRHSPGASSSGSSFDGSRSSSLEDLPRDASGPPLTQFSSLAEMIGDRSVDGTPILTEAHEESRGDSDRAGLARGQKATEATTPTQENHAPIIEGRYEGKHYGDVSSSGNMSNGQITQ